MRHVGAVGLLMHLESADQSSRGEFEVRKSYGSDHCYDIGIKERLGKHR